MTKKNKKEKPRYVVTWVEFYIILCILAAFIAGVLLYGLHLKGH
jgi:hypothetical protein